MRFIRYSVVLACCLSLATSVAFAGDGDMTFSLRTEEAHTGSNIKRETVRSGTLPLNKSYGEMSTEQRAIIRGWYESLGDRDEPPFPRDGLAPIYRQIAKAQQRVLVDAPVLMEVEVDPQGAVSTVSIVQSSGLPELDRYIAAMLMDAPYKPALCDGVPCRMSLPFRINLKTSL